jgi:hypothetical protein
MDADDRNDLEKWPDDDEAVFVPDDLYHAFLRILDNVERAVDELRGIEANRSPK